MNKQQEALKLALEALKELRMLGMNAQWHDSWLAKPNEAIAAIREALAEQPAQQQEPIAWIERDMQCDDFDPDSVTCQKPDIAADGWEWVPLYITTPRKPWVGLTEDEIDLLESLYAPPVHPDFVNDADHCLELIRHVEAKLKEKNA